MPVSISRGPSMHSSSIGGDRLDEDLPRGVAVHRVGLRQPLGPDGQRHDALDDAHGWAPGDEVDLDERAGGQAVDGRRRSAAGSASGANHARVGGVERGEQLHAREVGARGSTRSAARRRTARARGSRLRITWSVCSAMPPGTSVPRRRVDRHLTGDAEQSPPAAVAWAYGATAAGTPSAGVNVQRLMSGAGSSALSTRRVDALASVDDLGDGEVAGDAHAASRRRRAMRP